MGKLSNCNWKTIARGRFLFHKKITCSAFEHTALRTSFDLHFVAKL